MIRQKRQREFFKGGKRKRGLKHWHVADDPRIGHQLPDPKLSFAAAIAPREIFVYFRIMSFFGRINLSVWAMMALLAVNGCSPVDSSQGDEEKEPHFVLGDSRFNEMDWPGAIDAYEQSLEVNPHSAQAHYRLAQLFDTKQPDAAAAIYHYEQYLKLSPDANNRDVINQRIDSCKQQLASAILSLPSTPAGQRQMDALMDQNKKLQAQVDVLNGQLKDWSVYCASLQAALKASQAAAATPVSSATPDDITPQTTQQSTTQHPTQSRTTRTETVTRKPAPPKPPRTRTHIVTSGETMAGIAKKSGVSLAALQSVNPGVNPKKIRAGQTLNLPP